MPNKLMRHPVVNKNSNNRIWCGLIFQIIDLKDRKVLDNKQRKTRQLTNLIQF